MFMAILLLNEILVKFPLVLCARESETVRVYVQRTRFISDLRTTEKIKVIHEHTKKGWLSHERVPGKEKQSTKEWMDFRDRRIYFITLFSISHNSKDLCEILSLEIRGIRFIDSLSVLFDSDFDQCEIVTQSYAKSELWQVTRHDSNIITITTVQRKKKPRDIYTHESFIGV